MTAQGGRVTTVAIAKRAPARIAKGKLGVYFAWGAFSKRDGEVFTDSHGDRIPDDELVAGALSLAKSAQLGHEHDGTLNGSVPLVMPLPEDIQAALELTSPHAGLAVGFQPSPAFAASLEAGDEWEMSIEGTAVAELVKSALAKSADGADDVAKAAHKRTLRNLTINKIDLVKRGAHGAGTRIAIAKRAQPGERPAADIAKRAPALTDPTNGHQHAIYDVEESDGGTSYEVAPGSEYGHSHPWVRLADGSISIGEAAGHTHTVTTSENATMADDLAKSLSADLAKARGLLATAIKLPADQLAFAKRLDGAALESYLAKSDAERAAAATPIHKSERTGRTFFHGEEALVELAKDADAMHAEVAKSRAAAEQAEIAKSAAALPHLVGNALIAKAVHLLPESERVEATKHLATINASIGTVTQPIGKGQEPTAQGALAAFEAGLAAFAKTAGKSPDLVADDFLDTAEGARLYDAYAAEQAARR